MRVVIAEDEALLRRGLALVLAHGGFDVVAAAADGAELVDLAAAHRPELVITDIRMPPTHTDEGLVAALSIRATLPGVALVVLSQHVRRAVAAELLAGRRAGVGYLLKQRIADTDTFCADLRSVAAGGVALDPEVAEVMVSRAARAEPAVIGLTPRQREVLVLVAEGRSNAWIARRLYLSEGAVVAHTSHIYDALGLPVDVADHRRVLAVLRYLAR